MGVVRFESVGAAQGGSRQDQAVRDDLILQSSFGDEEASGQAGRRPALAWLLGHDRALRVRVLHTLASVMVHLLCVSLIWFGVNNGWTRPGSALLLTGFMVPSCLVFYGLIRSGWSERLADPSMTLAQVLVAQVWICGAYAVTNEAHGAMLVLFALVMFFSLFSMDSSSAFIAGASVILLAGPVMIFKSLQDPTYYPPRIELVNYILLAVTVPMMVYLAQQLARMRQRLKDQKKELARAVRRIRRMATRDELTGLINRRKLLSIMRDQKIMLGRKPFEIWVALIDLDHFKRVNDTHGHAVGDEVLKGFARRALEVLRASDVVGRWGGEEFVVLMIEQPGADPEAGLARLRGVLANSPISRTVPELRAGFSAGLARMNCDEPLEATLEQADAALYRAKAAGRNRTVRA